MIRINLLGQARPKSSKRAVPLESTLQIIFVLAAVAVAALVLGITYYQQKTELDSVNAKIAALQAEKASLQQIKQEVDQFESQKAVLQQRIDVIETLQRNRTGAQGLLQTVAGTVMHVDSLWLTGLTRTGQALDMTGEAGSINAVANFITQLKRSGYFDTIEIRDATENDLVPTVETYAFSMTASIAGPQGSQARTQSTSGTPAAAKRGANHGY